MSAGQNSRTGLLYFISALVGLSALAVIASLFMPWTSVPAGLFSSGSSGISAFSLAWRLAVEDETSIPIYIVSALVVLCLGIIVVIMAGVTRGGWGPWIKGSLLYLGVSVLGAGVFVVVSALWLSSEQPGEFHFGPGPFVFGLSSLMTFAGCSWGVMSLPRPP